MKPIIRWKYKAGWCMWVATLPDENIFEMLEESPFSEKLLAEFASLHQVKR